MRLIQTENYADYKAALRKIILGQLPQKILLIECMNCISQYLFKRDELHKVLQSLYIVRIEQAYDLLDLLKALHFNSYAKESAAIIMSHFEHLIEEKDKEIAQKILARLKWLEEKKQKQVILLMINGKWGTQFRQSGRSCTKNCQSLDYFLKH